MPNENGKFTIDYARLKEICLRAYRAYEEGRGIFREKESLLPQWNIPADLEYQPQRTETRSSGEASNYLWLLASMEKRSQTRQNIKNGLKVW